MYLDEFSKCTYVCAFQKFNLSYFRITLIVLVFYRGNKYIRKGESLLRKQ